MLVRTANGGWERPEVRSYGDEAQLQALVAESPELLSELDQVPGIAIRELQIPGAGYLDVLVVHVDGSLTLVEATLNRNAEIRRAVVGQLLGYAGGLWRMTYDELDASVRRHLTSPLDDLVAQVGADEFSVEVFRDRVSANLRDGAFRLVFAVDEITEDLRRAVEYLNAHTLDATEVVVVELAYAKVGDVEILLPRTFGEEAARSKRSRSDRPAWTEQDLLADLATHNEATEVAAVRQLLDWARERTKRFYFGEGQAPSCTLVFEAPEGEVQPCTIYGGAGGGVIGVNFEWVRKRPRAALEAFLKRTLRLPTVAAAHDDILNKSFAKRPSVPLSELEGSAMSGLIEAVEELLAYPPDGPTA